MVKKLNVIFAVLVTCCLTIGCDSTDNLIEAELPEEPYEKIDFSRESEIVEPLLETGLSLLLIDTDDGSEPTCEYVEHPAGAMGRGTTNAEKVPGRIRLVKDEYIIYDSGDYLENESGMTIRVRGNSSAYPDKKPYKIKLQKKADLLQWGGQKCDNEHWVLIKDSESMTTNNEMSLKPYIGMTVCKLVGIDYVPKGKYVNVVMNDEYRGMYFLSENVRRDRDCRVNVSKDGYIIEFDPYWWNEDAYFDTGITSNSFRYTFKYPDDDLTETRIDYIRTFILEMESHLKDKNLSEYIDYESFSKWILAHDLLGSNDTGGINKFFTKYDNTSDSKLKMGPLWDFDGIMNVHDAFPNIHVVKGFNIYYEYLFQNVDFVHQYKADWAQLSDTFLQSLKEELDKFSQSEEANAIDLSRVYEQQRWGEEYKTVNDNINYSKDFFTKRVEWLRKAIEEMSIVE